jgi:hypothetical protein
MIQGSGASVPSLTVEDGDGKESSLAARTRVLSFPAVIADCGDPTSTREPGTRKAFFNSKERDGRG